MVASIWLEKLRKKTSYFKWLVSLLVKTMIRLMDGGVVLLIT